MTKGILLDTCAFIWMASGDDRLKKHRSAINKASKAGELYLCPISVWEICVKASKGKIGFNMPVFDWIKKTKDASGVQNTEMSDDMLYQSTVLPGSFHPDPADRIIVATAMKEKLLLATGDRKILAWAKKYKLRTLSA